MCWHHSVAFSPGRLLKLSRPPKGSQMRRSDRPSRIGLPIQAYRLTPLELSVLLERLARFASLRHLARPRTSMAMFRVVKNNPSKGFPFALIRGMQVDGCRNEFAACRHWCRPFALAKWRPHQWATRRLGEPEMFASNGRLAASRIWKCLHFQLAPKGSTMFHEKHSIVL